MPTRIIVCADDYGFTPGVSRGIRELLAAKRISATSVMTGSPFWPAEAASLKTVAGDADIGLHLTLTDHQPLGAMPSLAPSGRFPSKGMLYKMALLRKLDAAEVEAEVDRQLAAFLAHFGRSPAHIDGHHHVHQLPGVREAVARAIGRLAGSKPYLRSCYEPLSLIRARGVAATKALIIAGLGLGLRRLATTNDIAINNGFTGVYDFETEKRGMADIFERFLAPPRENLLVMCHPGYVDDELKGLDSLTYGRETELAFLAGEDWPRLVQANGAEIGPFRQAARASR